MFSREPAPPLRIGFAGQKFRLGGQRLTDMVERFQPADRLSDFVGLLCSWTRCHDWCNTCQGERRPTL